MGLGAGPGAAFVATRPDPTRPDPSHPPLRVGVLKAYCKEHKLGVSGKKGDLVERVEAHLGAGGA